MASIYTSDFYELSAYPQYALLKVFENVFLDEDKVLDIQSKLKEIFSNKPFVLISDRQFKYDIDLSVYKLQLPNIKGMAVVSADDYHRERAIMEQPLFNNSFAFFSKMEDAVAWASTFLVQK
ncbi:hypothetical protein MG296_09210 [Flavobacteriaceae bacterium TK19130]|nr:hypothetical protein [Thermobacterium salinum]